MPSLPSNIPQVFDPRCLIPPLLQMFDVECFVPHRTHTLRVTVESTKTALSRSEEERDALHEQLRDLQDELVTLKRDNVQANELRSLALEERSKVSNICMCIIHMLCSYSFYFTHYDSKYFLCLLFLFCSSL